jgi:hypothetical protein
MKKLLTMVFAISLVFCMVGMASAYVSWNFDALPNLAAPPTIESYMESTYGSDISVYGAYAWNDGGAPLWSYPGDKYLQAGFGGSPYVISISFNTAPISEVSFDWGAWNTDFEFYANGIKLFDSGYVVWAGGHKTFNFMTPITLLEFKDSGTSFIGIDNLCVQPVPEPATMLLVGSGLIGLAGMRRKFRKN